jgi:hypothetical protein
MSSRARAAAAPREGGRVFTDSDLAAIEKSTKVSDPIGVALRPVFSNHDSLRVVARPTDESGIRSEIGARSCSCSMLRATLLCCCPTPPVHTTALCTTVLQTLHLPNMMTHSFCFVFVSWRVQALRVREIAQPPASRAAVQSLAR